jgi:hypothetical protein
LSCQLCGRDWRSTIIVTVPLIFRGLDRELGASIPGHAEIVVHISSVEIFRRDRPEDFDRQDSEASPADECQSPESQLQRTDSPASLVMNVAIMRGIKSGHALSSDSRDNAAAIGSR